PMPGNVRCRDHDRQPSARAQGQAGQSGYLAGPRRVLATAGPSRRQLSMPRLGSAAVVGRPVGLAAGGDRVVEHLVLLAHAGVAEVSRGTAVRGPGRRAELVEAVVAART